MQEVEFKNLWPQSPAFPFQHQALDSGVHARDSQMGPIMSYFFKKRFDSSHHYEEILLKTVPILFFHRWMPFNIEILVERKIFFIRSYIPTFGWNNHMVWVC